MRTIHLLPIWLLLCILYCIPSTAQNNDCGPESAIDSGSYAGTAFFNYGSTARSKSNAYRTALAIGQTFVGFTENVEYNINLGFYARYFLPPFALKVKATQGELLDRIQVNWEIDALGPESSDGFNIYRDGVFLASVASNVRSFNDFNVIAGQPYTYSVQGVNLFGEGEPAEALGFQVPNGTVTGWVSTINGSPVPGASVLLSPMQGFSAKFAENDGALAIADTSGTNPFLPGTGEDWTITFWMKSTSSNNANILSMPGLSISADAVNGIEGISVSASPTFMSTQFPDSTDNDWHHIALTYDGDSGKGRLYVDGKLAGFGDMDPVASPDSILIGALAGTGNWNGSLDELRFYHHRLDELDFDFVMKGTASSETPFLRHYWKMDEELGTQSYDIVNRLKLYFCGAVFDADRPPVSTAAITNEDGFYKIESASYGTGTTFLARPSKNFYKHRALSFDKTDNDYVTLPDFPITPKTTIEMWVNSAGIDGDQCLLSKEWGANDFSIELAPSGFDYEIRVMFNNDVNTFGLLGNGFQHLAFTLDSASGNITLFKNGVSAGTQSMPDGVIDAGYWSDPNAPWILGKRHDHTGYYGGLIDEIAFYDTTLSESAILEHFQNTRDIQEAGLRVYFPLDEGSGTTIGNIGSVLMANGTTNGTEWTPLAAHQEITPHIFTPATRQVTLNPSVTSVDQVDYIDRSTIGVSGYVRYQNTECFAKDVEILVNGQSFSPKIFTDSTGRFVIDFDPGTTAKLTPKFEDHVFVPAFWQITNLSSPVAGVLFNDITTRKITGLVAGGLCKSSITNGSTVCIVKVSSSDGCLERQISVTEEDGEFEFNNLPPLGGMIVAVVEHSDPAIKTAFDIQGGSVVNLTSQNDTIDFIYRAPPEVEIVSGLDPVSMTCNEIVLGQNDTVTLGIKLKEMYSGGTCYLDTAAFTINNGLADVVTETTMRNGLLSYGFRAGLPNPSPPYLKTIQIVGTTLEGREASTSAQAIITGTVAKVGTFTSVLPETPTLILHDPPGDGSHAFLEKNEKFCQKISFQTQVTQGVGGSVVIDIGPDVTIPTFFGVPDVSTQTQLGPNITLVTSAQKVNENTMEVCSSLSERISTSSDDAVVGSENGGDVYVGGALNIEFGFVDIVTFDKNTCQATDTTGTMVAPGNYATTFMYSEYFIKESVIPNLEILAEQTNDPIEESRYEASIERWNEIIGNNRIQRDSASEFVRNISFDAGTHYSYSETSDTTHTNTVAHTSITAMETQISALLYVLGAGGGFTVITQYEDVTGRTEDGTKEKGITTGYELSDDDPLDAFTIDVAIDQVYKTPVFNLKTGQSSCPHEPGTANRARPNLQFAPGSQPVATNVLSNEAAVYQLVLGNLSATNEDWTYGFTSVAAQNPHGAIIKLNGQPLNYIQEFHIPYGTSQTVTLTVERGPVAYDYDSLLVAQIAICEWGGGHIDPDTLAFSGLYLSAHFTRPCSEVDINVPQQDWVIFPNPLTGPEVDDNMMRITVSGYNLQDTNFQGIRLQYRPTGGDGAWINIQEQDTVMRFNPNWPDYDPMTADLEPAFTHFYWNTSLLQDGLYEIRAVAACVGDATDSPGYSHIIKGKIDREPPSLVGLPEPSDGILNVGDQISFTFNQHIKCNALIAADMMHANNVGLYDASTGELVDFNFTCFENKIVIDPTIQNMFLENRILRAEVKDIQDLTGNTFSEEDWSFFVDRNELAWLTDSAGITKFEDEEKSITVKIHNRGGYNVPFTIEDVPDWIHVTPDAGTLVPNEIRDIQFSAPNTLGFQWLSDTVKLITHPGQNPFFMGGTEALPVGVRNICRPPDWEVNPAEFQLSMTLITRIQLNGDYSEDPEDQVGVFINGKLRGTAILIQTPPDGHWIAYITVYGNSSELDQPLTFELFDASACVLYQGYISGEEILFSADGTHGTPSSPKILINNGNILRDLSVHAGWNWISFNLAFPEPDIDSVLSQLPNANGDLIKDQTSFSINTFGSWEGDLVSISNEVMHMYKAGEPRVIRISGTSLVPGEVSIPLVNGWNWISYIPTYQLPVNDALASVSATPGDIIRSQTAFAQYVNNTVGWVGNLQTMQAPEGYLLRLASAGILTYPLDDFSGDITGVARNTSMRTFWEVNASEYEHSSTLIGMFRHDNTNATTAEMELGAFVENEIRGVASAIYIESLDVYLFFLTCYSNTQGEEFQFRLYDGSTGTVLNLRERMHLTPHGHAGSIEAPLPFSLQTTGIADNGQVQIFDVYPNPFSTQITCRYSLPYTQEVLVRISDLNGKLVFASEAQGITGMNIISWNGTSSLGEPLSNGVYFLRLETEQGVVCKKIVLQR